MNFKISNKGDIFMLKQFKKLNWYYKEQLKSYIIGILALQILNIILILPPIFIGAAIDSISKGNITPPELFEKILILSALLISEYLLGFIWAYNIFKNSILIDLKLRLKIMNKILYMPKTFFERFTSGDIMARASSDIDMIGEMLGFGVLAFCDSITYTAAIILAMIFTVSWKLTLFSVLPLPFFAMISSYSGKYIHQLFTKQQEVFSNMNDEVLEHINGIRVVRSYVLEKQHIEEFEKSTKEVFKFSIKTEILASSFWSLTKFFMTISYAIAIGYGTFLVISNEISLGKLISFNVYLSYLVWPMFSMGEFINVGARGSSSIKRIYELLDEKNEILESNIKTLPININNISFDKYSFRYPSSNVDNLIDINISVNKGNTLGIVGKTGSGKSTLIKQLLKEYPKGKGKLTISDIDIQNIDKWKLMEHIGYVSQENILFSKTVKENILMAKPEAKEDEIINCLNLACMKKDIESFVLGIETMIGERGIAISGGQKQRLSIARALIKNPDILIMDDALSAVDAKTEANIIENIKNNRKNKTTILVSHRLSALIHADEIIVMDEGRIIQRGRHKELINKKGWYSEQYKIQQMEVKKDE